MGVEAVGEVYAQEAEHRHEDAQADTGGALEVEGVVVPEAVHVVAGFGEGEDEDLGAGVGGDEVAHFGRQLVVKGAAAVGGEGVVLVAAQANDLPSVQDEVLESVAAQVVAFQGGQAVVFVVHAEHTEFGIAAEDGVLGDEGVGVKGHFPLVVLHPAVFFGGRQLGVVASVQEGDGRRGFQGEVEGGSAGGEDGVVPVVPAEHEGVGQGMHDALLEVAANEGVVVDVEPTEFHLLEEGEVVVGPFEAASQADGGAGDGDFLGQRVPAAVGVHDVVVGADAQGVGLLASQPGLREGEGVGGEERAVGLGAEVDGLSVAGGEGLPGLFVADVAGREVVEIEAQGAHHGVGAPAALQLQLAGRLLHHGVFQVYGAGFRVRFGGDVDLAGVKIAQLAQFADGPLDVCAAEKISRAGADFAVHHVVVGAVVADDGDLVDGGGTALADADFQVDGVVFHACFHRHYVGKEVSVVEVQGGDVVGVGISVHPFVEAFGVVALAFLDAENGFQHVGGVFGVAHKGNVPEVVGTSFFQKDFEVEPFFGAVRGISDDAGVAEAFGVVKGDELALVVGVFVCQQFGRLEDVPRGVLVGVLEFGAQLGVGEGGVAFEVDRGNAKPHAEGDVKAQNDFVCGAGVYHLGDGHAAVGVAFFHIALGDFIGGGDFEVFRHHGSALELDELAYGVLLGFGETGEVKFGQFGQGLQGDGQEDQVSLAFVHVNLDVVEQFLVPKGFDRVGDFLAGEGDSVSDGEAAQELDDGGVQLVGAGDQDATDFVFHAGDIVGGGRSDGPLGPEGGGQGQRQQDQNSTKQGGKGGRGAGGEHSVFY